MFKNYSEMVAKLAKDGKEIQDSMDSNKVHLMHMVMGISGEVGELMDVVKKHIAYDKPLDIENVLEELGDIEFYLEGFRKGLHDGGHTALGRVEILDMNMSKLSKRYHKGSFSNDQANDRADKKVIPIGDHQLGEKPLTLSAETELHMTIDNALCRETASLVGEMILKDFDNSIETARSIWFSWIMESCKKSDTKFDVDTLDLVWRQEVLKK